MYFFLHSLFGVEGFNVQLVVVNSETPGHDTEQSGGRCRAVDLRFVGAEVALRALGLQDLRISGL